MMGRTVTDRFAAMAPGLSGEHEGEDEGTPRGEPAVAHSAGCPALERLSKVKVPAAPHHTSMKSPKYFWMVSEHLLWSGM